MQDTKLINYNLVKKLIENLCDDDCEVHQNQSIEGMNQLAPIISSTLARLDVVAFRNMGSHKVYKFAAEVNSNPMKDTELKAVLLGIDLLRLAKCGDTNFNTVCVWIFPKLDVQRFIAKVEICLNGYKFNFKLIKYYSISNAIDAIKYSLNATEIPVRLSCISQYSKFFIRLSDSDIDTIQKKNGM